MAVPARAFSCAGGIGQHTSSRAKRICKPPVGSSRLPVGRARRASGSRRDPRSVPHALSKAAARMSAESARPGRIVEPPKRRTLLARLGPIQCPIQRTPQRSLNRPRRLVRAAARGAQETGSTVQPASGRAHSKRLVAGPRLRRRQQSPVTPASRCPQVWCASCRSASSSWLPGITMERCSMSATPMSVPRALAGHRLT